jgi:acylglycerol lipase
MVMFHELNSHMNRGSHIAKALSEMNIITVGFDHRGFGKSQGTPGFI